MRRSGRRSARPIRCAFNRRGWLAFRTISVGGAGERAGRGRPGGGVGGRPAGRWCAGAAAWAGGVDGGTPGCGRPGASGCDPCRGRRGVDWRRGTAGGGRGVLVGGRHAGRAETVRRSTRRRGTSSGYGWRAICRSLRARGPLLVMSARIDQRASLRELAIDRNPRAAHEPPPAQSARNPGASRSHCSRKLDLVAERRRRQMVERRVLQPH